MSKRLHQHLITESDIRNGFDKIRNETLKVFKGEGLLEGLSRKYRPKDVDGEPLPDETKEMVTTVVARLNWTLDAAVRLIDYEATRDTANCSAKADLVVGDKTLAKGLPCTFLLALEKKLREIRDYYDAIPTLDMALEWTPTGELGKYKHGPSVTYRTAKKTVPVVMYEATDKHPAQVKDVVQDVTIGQFDLVRFSGRMHPRDKARYLTRLDALIAAVKEARMRANDQPVVEVEVGEALFKFVHDE